MLTADDLTIVTPSLPDRSRLLVECAESVERQSVRPADHRFTVDSPPDGTPNPGHAAVARNRLWRDVSTEWVGFLDDDDLLLPHHVQTVQPWLGDGADVIYTWPEPKMCPRIDVGHWPQSLVVQELENCNFIPVTITVRRSALERCGGFPEDWDPETRRFGDGFPFEDWALMVRLARSGARFRCVPVITWQYRAGEWERNSSAVEREAERRARVEPEHAV